MNTQETLFAQRQRMHAIRTERVSNGKCSLCGERDLAMNKNHVLGVTCLDCRRVQKRRDQAARRPRMRFDADGEAVIYNYLDTDEFRSYCVEVCEATTGKMCIGDYRRAMGERFDERHIINALNALVAVGKLKECWCVPSRWKRAVGN